MRSFFLSLFLLLVMEPVSTAPPPRHHPSRRVFSSASYSKEAALLEREMQDSSVSASLRESLMRGYDKFSFPFDSVWGNSTMDRTGLEVQLGLNFHRVKHVDVTSSVVDLIVWVRQSWVDPRLQWDPEEWGNQTSMHFWIESGSGQAETSEIWTPDLTLWNQETPIAESLDNAHATVSPDGTVFWSRPGHVQAVCRFQGLENFPFDLLDCQMEFGSWAYSGLYLRPIKMGDGFTVGGSETAGESFAEFSLVDIGCEEHLYPPYPSAPEEDWPVLFYHVSFRRAWQPYVRGYLVLQIILNLASFTVFWLPPHIGERMSLSITSMLAAVASELVVAANLPSASELTWFAKFSVISMLFTALALFESAAVIYFYYHTGDDLVPKWFRWLQKRGRAEEISTETKEREVPQEEANEKNKSVRFDEPDADSEQSGSIVTQPQQREDGDQSESTNYYESNADGSEAQDMSEVSMGDSRRSLLGSHQTISDRTRKSIKTILGRDADDFKNVREMKNNVKWQKVAAAIDSAARVCFPVAFAVFLGGTFTGLNMAS